MKISHSISHIIFDLDGVLLNTEPLYTQATQAVLDEFGMRCTWELKKDMMGRSEIASAEILIERLQVPLSVEAYLKRRNETLYRLIERCEPIEGAPEFVALLAQQGVPMAVATSSRRAFVERKASNHDWFSAFEVVVCGDDAEVAAFKPAPDIFLAAARRLGAAPEQCLVFEDSPAGVAAGLAAGMQVIALADANLEAKLFEGAELVIRGYDEIRLVDLGF